MSQDILYSVSGIALFAIGLIGVIVATQVLRKVLAINIMGIGIFMLLIATAQHEYTTDPIPHALVLTGIVVAAAGTALSLWLAVQVRKCDFLDQEDGCT